MSRRKQANKREWNVLNKQREEQDKPNKESKKEEINQEEHEEKVRILKETGLIK